MPTPHEIAIKEAKKQVELAEKNLNSAKDQLKKDLKAEKNPSHPAYLDEGPLPSARSQIKVDEAQKALNQAKGNLDTLKKEGSRPETVTPGRARANATAQPLSPNTGSPTPDNRDTHGQKRKM